MADTAGFDTSGVFTSEGTGAFYQPVGDAGGSEPTVDEGNTDSANAFYQSMRRLPYIKPLAMIVREGLSEGESLVVRTNPLLVRQRP